MNRQQLLKRVQTLREEGKSIRGIAAELGVHPSKVQRAVKSLGRMLVDESVPALQTSTSLEDLEARGFVGRQREIGEVKSALEDALSGQGRLVMLVGEPGIGKTRVAQELAGHAERRGAQVLWGRCYEEQGTPPYWPWVQPIRTYVQHRDPVHLQSEMGSAAADIAEIVPEVKAKLAEIEPLPSLDNPEEARFRLFDSISTFLKNAAQSKPLMLVLDDLHWADQPSLLLLQFLARQLGESRILVLCCYRDVEISRQHPLSDTLAALSRESVFQRHPLLGLNREDTARFIEWATGVKPLPEVVENIYAQTEGNPFFLVEVVKLLSERGELNTESVSSLQSIKVPVGVREAIGQRLNRRSQRCNQMLTVAALIGRQFSLALLVKLIEDLPRDSLLAVIDEAIVSGVIEELPEQVGRYQFSHALIQETLVNELSVGGRARLHAQIAQELVELYGAQADAHAPELARHFAAAEAVVGTDRFVHYSLLSGEQELAAYAWEEAIRHFQQALDAKEGQPMDAETAALLFGLGRAIAVNAEAHLISDGIDVLMRAFDFYAETDDVLSAVAIAQSPILMNNYGAATVLFARAFQLAPPNSYEAGSLLTRYVEALGMHEADYTRAMEASSQGLAIARRAQDTTLEMATMAQAAQVERFHLHPREGLDKSVRAVELASLANDPFSEILARGVATGCAIVLGDLDGARDHATAMLSLEERLGARRQSARALWWNAEVSRLVGDWRTAFEYTRRGLETYAGHPRLLSTRAVLECELGEQAQCESHLDQLLEVMRLASPDGSDYRVSFPAAVIPLVGRITGIADRLDDAKEAAEIVLSSPSVKPLQALTARTGLALAAVQQGDIPAAKEQYAALASQRHTMLPGWLMDSDRLLGLLSQTMGNIGQAVVHFEDALAFCGKAGYRPDLAWTCCDYADALSQLDSPGDHERVITLLDESLAISTELGMRLLMDRITARQENLGSRPAAPATYPDGLTPREVEVLRLIALGKSNREIAEELVVSLNTVFRHVSHIFSKAGATNRVEAAAYAARKHLFLG